MRTNSWYVLNDGRLIRIISRETSRRSGKLTVRFWQYKPYEGPEQPDLMNWNIVVCEGTLYRYTGHNQITGQPGGRLVKVSRERLTDIKPYWQMSFEEFQKTVRSQSYSRPMYSDPKYFSQRNSRRYYYYLYVNRDTLQVQKDQNGADYFDSENDSWAAKRMAYEYIIRKAKEKGLLDGKGTRLRLQENISFRIEQLKLL